MFIFKIIIYKWSNQNTYRLSHFSAHLSSINANQRGCRRMADRPDLIKRLILLTFRSLFQQRTLEKTQGYRIVPWIIFCDKTKSTGLRSPAFAHFFGGSLTPPIDGGRWPRPVLVHIINISPQGKRWSMMERPSPLQEPPSKSDNKLVRPHHHQQRRPLFRGPPEGVHYSLFFTEKRFIQFARDPVRRYVRMHGEGLKGERFYYQWCVGGQELSVFI